MTIRALACLNLIALAGLATAQMDGSEYVKVSIEGPLWPTERANVWYARVTFALDEGWHIYWRNPGDSGAPPSMKWTLPEGFEVVGVRWPAPHRINGGGIMSYGYDGAATLGVMIKTPEGTQPGKYSYAVETDYLVCKDLCLPGHASNKGQLELLGAYAGIINLPLPLIGKPDTATFKSDKDTVTLTFDIPQLAGATVASVYYFPAAEASLDHAAEQVWKLDGTKITLTVKRSKYATNPFSAVEGVLVVDTTRDNKKQQIAIEYQKTQEKQ